MADSNKPELFSSFGNADAGSDFGKLRGIMRKYMSAIATALPVEVVAVNGSGLAVVGYVDVKILIEQETAGGQPIPHATVFNLPYVRLQGGSNAVIIDPSPGDIGLAVFCSSDISAFKNTRAEAVPGSRRKFSLSDGVYIGGILNKAPIHLIQFTGNGVLIQTPGQVEVNAPTAVINASGKTTVTSPAVTINGNTTINGNLSLAGAFAQTGGSATMDGSLTTKGEVTAKGINLSSHVHGGVQSGQSNTGGPK